jgi:hypothetical protein
MKEDPCILAYRFYYLDCATGGEATLWFSYQAYSMQMSTQLPTIQTENFRLFLSASPRACNNILLNMPPPVRFAFVEIQR